MKLRLGVNIDHVATLRNARGTTYPSPFQAAKIVESSGADQVTIHLREDRRHIMEKDAIDIINNIGIDVNLEIAPTEEMIDFAIKNSPNYVCLVPEKREEITTEGGINVDLKEVKHSIEKLQKTNIKISLFIEPKKEIIYKCKELKIDYVELHTGKYANLDLDKAINEVKLISECAKLCEELKINCNAGHGLNMDNVIPIAQIDEIKELNIGHSIISDSLIYGLENSIKKMIKLINSCRK